MAIHVTPIPRLTTFGTPGFTLGTSNAAGDSGTAVASNSTLLTFDTTLPAPTGSAATGSAVVSARRDHVHALGTQTGPAKAWFKYNQSTNAILGDSFNITSVVDGGDTGESDVLWNTDFDSANYPCVLSSLYSAGVCVYVTTMAAGGLTLVGRVIDGTTNRADSIIMCSAFGNQ